MNYKEKLQDPRWQKKRLEILSRDSFTCQHCGSEKKTLHVHHVNYEKGKEPWDYPNHNFVTLCQDCHYEEPTLYNNLLREFEAIVKGFGITSDELHYIVKSVEQDLKNKYPGR